LCRTQYIHIRIQCQEVLLHVILNQH
jgi:hypothetical protein